MNFFGKTLEILKRTWNNAITNESTLNFNLDMFAYSSRDPKQDYEKNKNRFNISFQRRKKLYEILNSKIILFRNSCKRIYCLWKKYN